MKRRELLEGAQHVVMGDQRVGRQARLGFELVASIHIHVFLLVSDGQFQQKARRDGRAWS
jgi:hypothetical protein